MGKGSFYILGSLPKKMRIAKLISNPPEELTIFPSKGEGFPTFDYAKIELLTILDNEEKELRKTIETLEEETEDVYYKRGDSHSL